MENAQYSIAVALGKPQETVEVTGINVEGRRLLEEDSSDESSSSAAPDLFSANSSLPAWRRLQGMVSGCAFKCKKATLNIKYTVYASNENELTQVRNVLTSEITRGRFAQNLGIELAEQERSAGRKMDITSIYVSTNIEVQGAGPARPAKEPVRERIIPYAEQTTAAPESTTDSSADKQMAIAGGAFASRQLSRYAFLVIALVVGTIAPIVPSD